MTKTREERSRIAIDIMTKNLVKGSEQQGRKLSDSEARRQAQAIAERADKKRQR
jgi:hypothetical protein